MLEFGMVLKLAEEIECDPYVFRVGCDQCILHYEQSPLFLADDVPRHPVTGTITNPDCSYTDHTWFVQACLWRKDTEMGEYGWGLGGKILLNSDGTLGELAKKFFVAARDYSEHEVREAFKYRGRRVLGPHISLDMLWEAAE